MLMSSRAEFALRDPNALSAFLVYDWRVRRLLTDSEALGEGRRPGVLIGETSTSVLRHFQRLKWISAVHGVRPHGGRMRLWPITEVLKVQMALDLRALTGAKLAACVEALKSRGGEGVQAAVEDWERHIGRTPVVPTPPEALADELTTLPKDAETLSAFAEHAVAAFVTRNRFDEVDTPAFLRG